MPNVDEAIRILAALGSASDPVVYRGHSNLGDQTPVDADSIYAGRDAADAVPLEYYARPPGERRTRLVRGTLRAMVLDRVADATPCGRRRAEGLVATLLCLESRVYRDGASIAGELGFGERAVRGMLRDLARLGLAKGPRGDDCGGAGERYRRIG